MLKPIESLAVNDWVLLESPVASRFVGAPFQVSKISGSRVYLVQYFKQSPAGEREIREEKFVHMRSIRFAFSTEESANAVSAFARENSEEYEKKLRVLDAEHRAAFDLHIAAAGHAAKSLKA